MKGREMSYIYMKHYGLIDITLVVHSAEQKSYLAV